MNNTLHVFGCSYSQLTNEYSYGDYYNWCNGKTPPTWSELLSEKLDLNLKNYATQGASNEIIFQKFCQSFTNFKENDTVIFQWSHPNRFTLPNKHGSLVSVGIGKNDIISLEMTELLSILKSSEGYIEQLFDYQKVIDYICESKKIKIWYWNGDSSINKFVNPKDKRFLIFDKIIKNHVNNESIISDVISDLGGLDIDTETNGEIKDGHYGESSHKIQSELFYDHIKKYENIV